MSALPTVPATSRRSLIAGIGLGLLAGGAWGAGLRAVATPSDPRMSVVGAGSAQLVLLDTTSARVLFVLGSPYDQLPDQIPALMSLFRQRIDVVVGAAPDIAALGSAFRERWRVSLVAPVGIPFPIAPPASHERYIGANTDISAGDGISIRLKVTPRNGWPQTEASSTLWVAEINIHGYRVIVAPDAASLRVLAAPNPTLAVLPDGAVTALGRQIFPGSIAINHDSDGLEITEDGVVPTLVRIYPEDIANFNLLERGVTMPEWAEIPG